MNKNEFLDTLENHLDRLPYEEKRDALNYYKELFDEAGAEKEQEIIENLDTPENIARQLLIENGISPDYEPEFLPEKVENSSTFSENTNNHNSGNNSDTADTNNNSTFSGNVNNQNNNNANSDYGYTGSANNSKKNSKNNTAIIIIILVLASPMWLGIVGGIFGAAVGILAAIAGILIALCAVSIALIAAGIMFIFSFPPAGVIVLGTGLIIAGVSALIIKPIIRGIWKLLVLIVDKSVSFIKKLLGKGAYSNGK